MRSALHFLFTTLSVLFLQHVCLGAAADSVSGIVRDAKGHPVAEAEVRVAISNGPGVELAHGGFASSDRQNQIAVLTGQDGRFEMPLPQMPAPMQSRKPVMSVVAVHPVLGIGERLIVDANKPVDIGLEEWCRIEGVAKHADGSPAGNEHLTIDRAPALMGGLAMVWWRNPMNTEADGKFVVARVPPGHIMIARSTNPWLQRISDVHVKPGETSTVNVDFDGAIVRGTITLPVSMREEPGLVTTVLIQSSAEPPLRPAEIRVADHATQLAWYDSAEGRKYIDEYDAVFAHERSVSRKVNDDGTFAFAHLSPGTYTLTARTFLPDEPPQKGMRDVPQPPPVPQTFESIRGYYTCEIVVPEPDVTREVMIPPFEMRRFEKKIDEGDTLPSVALVPLTDDRTSAAINLDTLKGKYVLLDFWATWCGPCIANEPKLKSMQSQFGGDQFEIIGVTLDKRRDRPLKHVTAAALPWKQYMFNDPTREAGANGLTDGLPTYILIDPSGRVVWRGHDVDESRAQLKAMLKK